MKFEFNTLDELDAFFSWIVATRPAPSTVAPAAAGVIHLTGDAQTDAAAILATSTAVVAGVVETCVGPAVVDSDKPKRTRRTKAEIEAERTSAAVAQDNADATAEPAPAALTPEQQAQAAFTARANSLAASAGETPQAVEGTPVTEVLAVGDYIASRTAERPEVSQIDHLNLARAFVAKHGVAKYNETFALAGLQSNVMVYTPTDCAVHAAVLEWAGSSQAA